LIQLKLIYEPTLIIAACAALVIHSDYARPPPAAVWSVEVSVDDLRYCSRCERSRSSSQSFSVRLRWHRQHPRRPNIVVRRRPICRLITRPHVDPASVSRAVPRVYRQTRLAGQDRIPGDTLALGRQAAHGRAAADRGQYRQAVGASALTLLWPAAVVPVIAVSAIHPSDGHLLGTRSSF